MNYLYYGDNLDVLSRIDSDSVHLVYLDPPFNSQKAYNVFFGSDTGEESQAQIEAFDDTWHWSPEVEAQYRELIGGEIPLETADALEAMYRLLGPTDLMAYLTMMTPRLAELRRVLAPTGTLWLHCDPTASHYLKIILDAVFGTGRFLNEVIWQRTSAHNRTTRFGPVHDVILAYTKSEAWTWNPQYVPYDEEYVESFYRHVEGDTGRRYRLSDLTSNRPGSRQPFQGQLPPGTRYWGYAIETMERFASEDRIVYTSNNYPQYKRYLDEMPGKLLQDLWTDIPPLSTRSAERLGYPTQKPEALLERIIIAGSNEGDLVLDPFAGCGTAIAVAQRLRRRWIGVDVAFLAVDLMDKRLRARYDEAELAGTYDIHGIPRDLGGAQALFEYSPFEFEKWAVSRVQGQPHERQTGDRGVDGTIRFPLRDTNQRGRVLVSVKGGERLTPSMVRDLIGTVDNHRAEMGLMITLAEPTPGMVETAKQAGSYVWDLTGRRFDRVQIVTVAQLLSGQTLQLPAAFLPYVKAKRTSMAQQGTLGI